MSFGYGGRAYDDDNAWWQDNEDISSTPSQYKPSKQTNAYDDKHTSNSYESKESVDVIQSTQTHSNTKPMHKHSNVPKQISNPSYRNQIRNKYRQNYKRTRPQVQRPEIHCIQQQETYKEELRKRTKSHLDDSLRTAYQIEDIAADTSQHLYHQRKQLENVDKMLHETDGNLDRTEHTLKGMKSIWGGITNYFRPTPQRKQYEKKKSVNIKKNNNQSMNKEKSLCAKGDEEMNDKLDELHKSVQRMKIMTENMNRELDDEGGLLEDIDDKMNKIDQRIHKQNYTMNRIR